MAKPYERQIEIGPTDRMALVGKTKSGKTTLARALTAADDRLAVLDPKSDPAIDRWGLAEWSAETRKAFREGEPGRLRVRWGEGSSEAFWDDVLWEILESGRARVVIDEVVSLSPSAAWAPESMQRIFTQGRTYEVSAIALSQRPRRIPGFILTESEHFAAFRLQRRDDRIYMADYMGDEVRERIPARDRFGFWYYCNEDDRPAYVPGIDLGAGDPWEEVAERVEEA